MTNRWKLCVGLVSTAVLGVGLTVAGCGKPSTVDPSGEKAGSKQSSTPDQPVNEKPRIALVMKSLANEFFLTMSKGAEAHQSENADKYELITNGMKDERDLNQQVKLVEQMIAEKVDAIVIAPADSKALVPICKRAIDAGIVVINIDNKLDAGVLAAEKVKIPFVGPDNRQGARMVGDYLAKRLKPGDKVTILEGLPTAFNAQQRRKGFEEAMNAAGMEIVDVQSGEWETAKANTIASTMINGHPELKAILCSNDSMALGAEAAVKAANKRGQILIVGFDNISAIQQMLKEGHVLATADQHADRLAVYGIELALKILGGERTPVDLITTEK